MRSRKITRTRYYCDFCEKGGRLKGFWTLPAITKHERGCTANPNRICGLCSIVAESSNMTSTQRPIADLVACLSKEKEDFGMKELRELADECPACILAAIRQSGLQQSYADEDGFAPGLNFNFDFKAELLEFWNAQNETEIEHHAEF